VNLRGNTQRTEKGNNMDETLRAKLDEARERMNSKQAGINANRKHDDPAMREWARGKQRPANAERIQFRNSLTDEDRSQIEERIQQLVDDNPDYLPGISVDSQRTRRLPALFCQAR
jgi:hypothetical protein